MSPLELEESKHITEINPNLDSHTAEIGLLPMIDYLFEEVNIATTIFMDEGSNTSCITTKLAKALNLEGEVRPTKVFKAGEEKTQPMPYRHHVIELKDREGKAYKIKCIEVPFITSIEKQPNLEKI